MNRKKIWINVEIKLILDSSYKYKKNVIEKKEETNIPLNFLKEC